MVRILGWTFLLALSINAMELVENVVQKEHDRTIPTLQELCLKVVPETIQKRCSIEHSGSVTSHSLHDEKIKNIMQNIPKELHPAIISACLLPNFKETPEQVIVQGAFRGVSPDHAYICSVYNGMLSVLDIKNHNAVVKEIICDGDGGYIRNAVFSQDNTSIACLSLRSLAVYALTSDCNKKIINNLPSDLHAFNDDMVLATESTGISLWDFNAKKIPSSRRYNRILVGKVVFCGNNSLAYINKFFSANKNIIIFSIASDETIKILEGHAGNINDLESSLHETSLLASASEDTTVRIWDPNKPSGEEGIGILRHPSTVYAISFNPAGTLIASGDSTTIRIWDIQSQRCIISHKDTLVHQSALFRGLRIIVLL